ncbi:MAG TPA: Hsp70 family protein, partial [Anaerolineaceae bacterium]|nr:Hsp70 family protein [Anaerolineaceae bacterium]
DIEKMVKEAELHAEEDRKLKSLIEARNESDTLIYSMEKMIREMEKQMRAAAAELQFERAAMLRDQVYELRALLAENSKLPPWKQQNLLAGRED